MRRLAQIALFVVVALLYSCSNKAVVRETEPIYTPRYAKGFTIERDIATGERLLCVKNPWQGAEDITYYTKLDTLSPPKRIVAMSSSHIAMLDAAGVADRIIGVSGAGFISTPSVVQRIEKGEIFDVGYDGAFDFENIIAIKADLVLLYGVVGETQRITDKLDELRIPYIYIGDYLESDPLGKAEWSVAIAYICGVEKEGLEFFNGVAERYNALKERKYCSAYKPRVMLNLPYRDTWFMPPHNSYMVRLIEDAGGEYVLAENDSITSKPISLEEALELALKADFWINLGQIASLEELRAAAPHFTKVDAVRFGRIYNNTKRTNKSRGSDFWESGAIRPDIILEDLIKILHHEAPTEELYYYQKMK